MNVFYARFHKTHKNAAVTVINHLILLSIILIMYIHCDRMVSMSRLDQVLDLDKVKHVKL